MEYATLGRSGLIVSRLCLGCMSYGRSPGAFHGWGLDHEASLPFFRQALEVGINFFDTANIYAEGESERITGEALKQLARRDEIVIATKVHGRMRKGPNGQGLSRKAIMQEIDASLQRLQTDYVDLYQIHRFDPDTPVEETLEALHDVVKAGKARYLGASSMAAWQFMKMLGLQRQNGWSRFVSMQNHYNLLYREEEREMIPLCRAESIALLPWSPLARGRLARPFSEEKITEREQNDAFARHFPDAFDRSIDEPVIDAVQALAAARKLPAAQIAMAWVMTRNSITSPIVGATKPHHLTDAVAALEIALQPAEIELLERSYRPRPVIGHN